MTVVRKLFAGIPGVIAALTALSALPTLGQADTVAAVPDAQHVQISSAPQEPLEFHVTEANIRVLGDSNNLTVSDYHQTVLWSGPVPATGLVITRTAGAEQVRSGAGAVFWSQKSDFPACGLALDEGDDGQAQLTDSAGKILWKGTLNTQKENGYPPDAAPGATSFVAKILGVAYHVDGEKAWIEDAAHQTLWSGHTPDPVSLRLNVPGEIGYYFLSQTVSSLLGDFSVRLTDYRPEAGTVEVHDSDGRTVGTAPIIIGHLTAQNESPQITAPRSVVAVTEITPLFTGTLSLSFLDEAGHEVADETLQGQLVHSKSLDGQTYDSIRYDRNYHANPSVLLS